MKPRSLKRISAVFAIIFGMSLAMTSFMAVEAPMPEASSAGEPSILPGPSSNTDFTGVASLLTSLVSAVVSISTLVLAWRKDRRESTLLYKGVIHTENPPREEATDKSAAGDVVPPLGAPRNGE